MTPALRSRLSAVVMTAVLAGMAVSLAAASRPITETDLSKFVWIADPQMSPDGSAVVYTRVIVNEKDDGYDTDLWLVPADASRPPRRLTAGPRDTSPRWSPDGRAIAFVRAPAGEDHPSPPQIHLLSLDGGEARPLTSLAQGASGPSWSPDGRAIAFTSATTAGDDPEKAEGEKAGKKSDVRVITRAVYRANGGGYLDPVRHTHIWTVAVPGPAEPPAEAKPVTSGEFSEGNVQWSPDGTRLSFTSSRVKEPYYEQGRTDLYTVPVSGGDTTKLLTFDGGMRRYAFSPDGRTIAFTGAANHEPERSYDQTDLWVVENRAGATARNLTAGYDFAIGGGIGGDQHAPRGGQPGEPVWSADGRALYVLTAEQGRSNLVRVDAASGAVSPVTTGDHDLISYTASSDASRFVTLVSTTTGIGDLFAFDAPAPAKTTRLTRVNDALFSGLTLTPPETFWYTSFDGTRIQGWIQKPPDFDAAQQVPDDPRDPRRAALGVRLLLLPRDPVDGGQGLRGALREPARQHVVRAGLRQRHPVPLPRRRLQGSDGRRRRTREARLRGPAAPRRDRRQRRRAAHQLGGHADDALRGGGLAAVDRRLGRVLVHGRLHAVHAVVVPRRAVGGPEGLRRALADHPHREREDAAHADRRRRGLPHAARATAASRCSAR